MLSFRPIELGFESTWGQVLASFFLSFASFLPLPKSILFSRCSDLVICGFFVWSDSVRTATAVVIMYLFTAGAHALLYGSTINVRFTAVGRQMNGFEPFLHCALFSLFFVLFWVGEWVKGFLSKCPVYSSSRTPDEWVRTLSFPSFCVFFALFSVLFFGWVRGVNYSCCSYSSIFHTIPQIYRFLAF